jgi:hypothetical protein
VVLKTAGSVITDDNKATIEFVRPMMEPRNVCGEWAPRLTKEQMDCETEKN